MELTSQVRHTAAQLTEIQRQLHGTPSLEPELADAVEELKTAVDHMRHFLWALMESQQSPVSIDAVRMQRVTEMLRKLEEGIGSRPQIARTTEARSMFEAIEQITAATLARRDLA